MGRCIAVQRCSAAQGGALQRRDGAVHCSTGSCIAVHRPHWLHPRRLERLQRIVTKLQTEAGLCEEQLNQADALLQAVSAGGGAAMRGAVHGAACGAVLRGVELHGEHREVHCSAGRWNAVRGWGDALQHSAGMWRCITVQGGASQGWDDALQHWKMHCSAWLGRCIAVQRGAAQGWGGAVQCREVHCSTGMGRCIAVQRGALQCMAGAVQCSTVLRCSVCCSVLQCNAELHGAMRHHVMHLWRCASRCSTAQGSAAQCSTAQCSTAQCSAVWYHAAWCSTVHTTRCCTM